MFGMKKMQRLISIFAIVSILISPTVLFAQTGSGGTGGPTGSEVPSSGETIGIDNPIRFNSLDGFIFAIVEGIAQIGLYLVVIFIIYSGFLFVKARGNPEELKKAKAAFLYTVIGAAVLLGATLLANVIEGTITQLREGDDQTQRLP